MRHEDFTTLEIDDILSKVLTFGQQATGAKSVHWLSSFGLDRVHESSSETWHWAFSTADVVGKHVISRPAADLWDLFHVWRKVSQLYPQKMKTPFIPHVLAVAPTEYYVLPVAYAGILQGILLFDSPAPENAVTLFARLKPEIEIAAKYLAFAYRHLDAKNLSYLDELTGLYNQRYLPMVLAHEIERSKRDRAQFSLLFLDIDYFKMVNDGRGHWVGSKLLVELGNVLRSQVRSCDYAFRYGGDEFIILLSSSNADTSKKVAERIRKSVEDYSFNIEGHNMKLTVSIGLAAYPEHAQNAQGLIQLADQAMYYGKRKSRNVVFVAS